MARNVRSKDERIADLNEKIEKKKAELATLEEKKYRLEHPISMRDILSKAKEAGMTPEQVAEKLGITID